MVNKEIESKQNSELKPQENSEQKPKQNSEAKPQQNSELKSKQNSEPKPQQNSESKPKQNFQQKPKQNFQQKPKQNYEIKSIIKTSNSNYNKLKSNYNLIKSNVNMLSNKMSLIKDDHKNSKTIYKSKKGYLWTNNKIKKNYKHKKIELQRNALYILDELEKKYKYTDNLINRIKLKLKESEKYRDELKGGIISKSDRRVLSEKKVQEIKDLLLDAKIYKKLIKDKIHKFNKYLI
jgi:hypothetical protein